MKFDDFVYNLLEQSSGRGVGKFAAGALTGAAALYAASHPEKIGQLYAQYGKAHVDKAVSTAKQQMSAHKSPEHPTEPQFKEPGPSHAPQPEHHAFDSDALMTA
jgi:hypothetical protein